MATPENGKKKRVPWKTIISYQFNHKIGRQLRRKESSSSEKGNVGIQCAILVRAQGRTVSRKKIGDRSRLWRTEPRQQEKWLADLKKGATADGERKKQSGKRRTNASRSMGKRVYKKGGRRKSC